MSSLLSSDVAPSPRALYAERIAARSAALAEQRVADRLLANLRLAVFAGGSIVAGLAAAGYLSWAWIPAFGAGFVALIIRHDRVIRECERLERAVGFYDQGLARVENRWMGRGKSGQRFRDPAHPYAEDLDLFGNGSLFERLCTARTAAGEEQLAEWLKRPAPVETIRDRQEAATELQALLELREELDMLASVARRKVQPSFLVDWATAPAGGIPVTARLLFGVVGLSTLIGGVLWFLGEGLTTLVVSIVVGQLLVAPFRRRIATAVKGVDLAALELAALEPALAHLESGSFESRALTALKSAVARGGGSTASETIGALQTLDGYLQMRHNFFTGPFMELLLLTPQVAASIAGWRREHGSMVSVWIKGVGEFEALNALASYSFENPEDVFPELVEEGPLFNAEGLAHPLLPVDTEVRNDLRIGDDRRLFIVSGSNMSGKSTLLRAVGANAVLAQMGAPVRARSLDVSPLLIGASIRTQDSLQEGISRFYAEILRLRAIVELAGGSTPVLFLLDEILHGTNSHDRRIGAEAVARALLERGAIGLLTTHDLALARIAEDPKAAAANVHFQDELMDGEMSFDYRLRPGVVEKSNALELMRAVGLEV
jgi:hypothetical protein